MTTAHLSATFTLSYEDHRGRECEAEVEVDYTFDGTEARIVKQRTLSGDDWAVHTDWFDELVWQEVQDAAPEAYAEWLADYGEYLRDQRMDREAA